MVTCIHCGERLESNNMDAHIDVCEYSRFGPLKLPGGVAQLVEHSLDKTEATGSIPVPTTKE